MRLCGPSVNTSCPKSFRTVKRILIEKFYRQGFSKMAIQASKRIVFRMRDDYLEPSKKTSLLHPIPVRTKFYNCHPSVGIISWQAWWRVLDDYVLSHHFPTAPFQSGAITLIWRMCCLINTRNFLANTYIGNLVYLLFRNLIGLWLENAVIRFKVYCALVLASCLDASLIIADLWCFS